MAVKMATRVCPNCGKTETKPARKLYGTFCSPKCAKADGHARKGNHIECLTCKNIFYMRKSKKRKFCCQDCYMKYRQQHHCPSKPKQYYSIVCKNCETEFVIDRRKQIFAVLAALTQENLTGDG